MRSPMEINQRKKKAKHELMIEDNGVEMTGMDIVSKYTPTRSKNRSQQIKSTIVGSFPLHHNRTVPKVGVHIGSEQMVWSQGRNAKRIWARMITSNGVGECYSNKDMNEAKDDESSSSRSINLSDERATAAGKRASTDTNSILNDNNQLLRLTRQIHELPKTTHRQHFVSSVANELGRNRYIWEETLRQWVERNDYFSQEKQCAIKYSLE